MIPISLLGLVTENNSNPPVYIGDGDRVPHYSDVVLMQYTGLKDKNGKEIFEGDIVRIVDKNYWVEWNRYVWAFNSKTHYKPFSSYDDNTLEELIIEVIGNIHENPELLEMEEEALSVDKSPC